VADEGVLDDLAGAILDGDPIDWGSVESGASETERALLDHLRQLAALADHLRDPVPVRDLPAVDDTPELGRTVGAYRLVELLGRGGMGEVYLAERADGRFDQRVAVKLVRRGMDSTEILRRFSRERRILARLDHPGIARLLDAGETPDGRPYFVMERVEGERITEHCRTRRLSLEERVRLLASCCDAVDAAHRSLIVHRDLKPSNILVTPDGAVKLLDFGIATFIGDEEWETRLTRHGGHVLTTAYAAPEQIAGGPVTVATDVFALGVVFYEILTDTRPYDRRAASPGDLIARVQHEVARRPSVAVRRAAPPGDARHQGRARRLQGDLDTIALKALAHEPERRYPSAAAFGEDLRCYLSSRPVSARPDSRGYRLRKFVNRYRLAVAASIAVAATVVAALGVSLTLLAASRREAQRATAAHAFLTSLFEGIDPSRAAGSSPSVRDLLERGRARVDRELASQPELRAEMQVLLAQVFDQLALPDQGEALWRQAAATYLMLFGPDDLRTAKARKGLAISLARQARYPEAERIFEALLTHPRLSGDVREHGSLLLNYGNLKRLTGQYDASAALLERAVALLEATEPDGHTLGRALNNLGLVYWRAGRDGEAANTMARSLSIRLAIDGPQSGDLVPTLINLTLVHRDLDDPDSAARYGRQAIALAELAYPPDHPLVGQALEAFGTVLQKRGQRAEARALYVRAIATYEASSRPDHPDLAGPLSSLSSLLLEEGETLQALRVAERALGLRRKAFGEQHADVARSWHDIARARLAAGDVTGALAGLRHGVEIFRATVSDDSHLLAAGLVLLGDVLQSTGRPGEALPYLEEAHAIWRRKPPADPVKLRRLDAVLDRTRTALR